MIIDDGCAEEDGGTTADVAAVSGATAMNVSGSSTLFMPAP
jgi:hypothetical protein